MEYIITFLEGIVTFISPCILPMIPIYISYFMGQEYKDNKTNIKALFNAIGFIFGFTCIFVGLALILSLIGTVLKEYMKYVNILLGILILVFGLNILGVIKINNVNIGSKFRLRSKSFTFISSFVFGIIFGLTWSPCVGAFLGSALSIVIARANIIKGIILIVTYCMGLGIPFIISTLLIEKLKSTFNYIKTHYNIINKICGIFLCIIGILMITGLINKYFELVG